MDKILIEGLTTKCILGWYDWERKRPQRVQIDLEIEVNVKRSAKPDHLESTIDYSAVAKRVFSFVEKSSYRLIETLAEELTKTLLKSFKIEGVRLRLFKPAAIASAKRAGIEIYRSR